MADTYNGECRICGEDTDLIEGRCQECTIAYASVDFQDDGKARLGWEKICKKLLDESLKKSE